jgi:pimeloyl-ACP methyl ester carboxylesterase
MAKLFSRELGGAGRPPLIVLHGMLGSSRNWLTAGGDLAQRYHVWALDLRNHGRSPHETEMTYDALVADVIEWMDDRGLPRAAVLGHSMGGKTAMLLACRHLERIERLLVVDIAPKNYFWVGHRTNFAAMNEMNLADLHSRAEAELRLEARVHDWALRKFLTTNLEQAADGRWRWQINLPAITAALPVLEANSLRPSDRYEGPTRFIVGGRSDYVTAEDEAAIRTHFPAAEIVRLAGSGHNPHMEARADFVAAVLDAAASSVIRTNGAGGQAG